MNKLGNNLIASMQKFATLKHVVALRDGMMASLSASLIGSFFLIIRFFPIEAWTTFMDSHKIGEYLLYPVAATMDMLGIIILFATSYRLAENYDLEPLGACLTAFMAYLVVTPLEIFVNIPEQVEQLAVAAIPIQMMGTKGLFVAMLIAVLAVEIYRKVIQANLVIKMPDSVPPAVAKSFIAVVPTLAAIIVALAIRLLFENTSYGTLNNFIQEVVSAPLIGGVRSFWGSVSYYVIYYFFWSFGIHGSVTDSVFIPIWTIINDENRLAFQQGLEIPNLLTQQYLFSLTSASTLACIFLCLITAKSTHLKQVGKLAIGPGIFHIAEPIIFGVPVALNPIMMIPYTIVPGILSINSYIWVYFGWASRPTGVTIPWTMPYGFDVYLQTNGSMGSVLLMASNIIIALICFYPFFKIIDKSYVSSEKISHTNAL